MTATKIRAGRYTVNVKSGSYTVKNLKPKVWLVLNDRGRLVGKFTTLGAAEGWLETLASRPATAKSKKYMRDLLAKQEGTELAENIRAYFNRLRESGGLISQSDVSLAIKRLENPENWGRIPAQPTMTKAEALESIRATLEAAKV